MRTVKPFWSPCTSLCLGHVGILSGEAGLPPVRTEPGTLAWELKEGWRVWSLCRQVSSRKRASRSCRDGVRSDARKHSESWGARQWGQWRASETVQWNKRLMFPSCPEQTGMVIKRSMGQGRDCPQPLSFPSAGQKWHFQGPQYCSPCDSEVPTELAELKGNACSGWPTWRLLTRWVLLEGSPLPVKFCSSRMVQHLPQSVASIS